MCRITSVIPITATSSARTTRRSPRPAMRVPPSPKNSASGASRRISVISSAPYCSPLASPADKKIFGLWLIAGMSTEPQVPPLRYAPVGMTNLFHQKNKLVLEEELSSRPERSAVEGPAVFLSVSTIHLYTGNRGFGCPIQAFCWLEWATMSPRPFVITSTTPLGNVLNSLPVPATNRRVPH